jgi:hypothetical protein
LRAQVHDEKMPQDMARPKLVQITRVKRWACSSLPANSTLREVLIQEKENLSIEEFLAKMDVWLKLCLLEGSKVHEGGSTS